MSLKEVSELLKDLIESQKQLTLRLKMIEIEINYIKENLPGRITNMIEKTDKFDKKVSQKYIKDLAFAIFFSIWIFYAPNVLGEILCSNKLS